MKYFLLILIGILTLSCSDSKSKMYQDSELALLMRKMYDNQLEWKEFVEEGKLVENFSDEFEKIHTAKPTKKNLRTPDFQTMSNAYLNTIQTFKESKNAAEQKENYNAMIQMCVTCHQTYCPGPIKKIKKLEVED